MYKMISAPRTHLFSPPDFSGESMLPYFNRRVVRGAPHICLSAFLIFYCVTRGAPPADGSGGASTISVSVSEATLARP
jgi:hypothetical protein